MRKLRIVAWILIGLILTFLIISRNNNAWNPFSYSHEGWWNRQSPYGLLFFGIFWLVLAVIGMCTGKALGRGYTIRRTEEPKNFLMEIIFQHLIGIFFIGYFLYKIHGLPIIIQTYVEKLLN